MCKKKKKFIDSNDGTLTHFCCILLHRSFNSQCLIMFALLTQIIAFDELKTDYKNPIDQCNSLNPVRLLNTI